MFARILVVIACLVTVGCTSRLRRERIDLKKPSVAVARAVSYLQSEQFVKDAIRDNLIEDFEREKFKSGNLILDGVEYLFDGNSANVSFDLRSTIHVDVGSVRDGIGKGSHETIRVWVDEFGSCRISGTGSGSGTIVVHPKRKATVGSDLDRAVATVEKYIAENSIEVAADDFSIFGVGGMDFKATLSDEAAKNTVENLVKKRMPERLLSEDLELKDVKVSSYGTVINLCYYIKPSVVRKSSEIVAAYSIDFQIGKDGKYYKGSIQECLLELDPRKELSNLDDNSEETSRMRYSKAEREDIYETAYRHMFKHAANWEKEVKFRFISIGTNDGLSTQFYQRFKSDKIPVRSPYKRLSEYGGNWTGQFYYPNGDDALFYGIGEVRAFDDTHVFVSCNVMWGMLAARGYLYTLQKIDGKWKVVRGDFIWLS